MQILFSYTGVFLIFLCAIYSLVRAYVFKAVLGFPINGVLLTSRSLRVCVVFLLFKCLDV